jgi:hypothetical protein
MTSLPEFLLARIEDHETLLHIIAEANDGPLPSADLATLQAHRAIVTSYRSTIAAGAELDGATNPGQKLVTAGMATGLRIAVQLLASLHSDHPDYREEWANLKGTDKP